MGQDPLALCEVLVCEVVEAIQDQLAFCEVLVCEVVEAIQGHLFFAHPHLEAE